MRLRKLGTALALAVAIGVLMTTTASAAVVGTAATWRTGTGGTVLTGAETVTSTGSVELVTTVGETPLVLKSTGLNCVECIIQNSEGLAEGGGKLEFTGVTVSTPSSCAVSGGRVTTLALASRHWFHIFNFWYTGYRPRTGTTLATVTLVKGSGTCPLAGSYIVKGNLWVKGTNSTGVYAVSQTFASSGAINSEAGGELFFGNKVAELQGTATFSLSGAKKGEAYGVHE